VIGQAAVGKGNVWTPLEYDNLSQLIQPPQPGGATRPSGHTADDHHFFTHLMFWPPCPDTDNEMGKLL
jgi:hypothetical protein